jgi:hypothetical protein
MDALCMNGQLLVVDRQFLKDFPRLGVLCHFSLAKAFSRFQTKLIDLQSSRQIGSATET